MNSHFMWWPYGRMNSNDNSYCPIEQRQCQWIAICIQRLFIYTSTIVCIIRISWVFVEMYTNDGYQVSVTRNGMPTIGDVIWSSALLWPSPTIAICYLPSTTIMGQCTICNIHMAGVHDMEACEWLLWTDLLCVDDIERLWTYAWFHEWWRISPRRVLDTR